VTPSIQRDGLEAPTPSSNLEKKEMLLMMAEKYWNEMDMSVDEHNTVWIYTLVPFGVCEQVLSVGEI
jgi:hypothetical protein